VRQLKIVILTFMLVCILCTGNALAYNAYSYGTDYRDGVNTRAAAQDVNNKLNNIGYQSFYKQDESASNAWGHMANAQVWFYNGHGNAGRASFKPGTTYTDITGTKHDNNFFFAINRWNSGELNDNALNVFVSCYSACDSTQFGNLLIESVKYGVDSAIGFSGEIGGAKSDSWAKKFAYYLDQQYSIHNAAAQAAEDVYREWPYGFGGTNNFVIRGSSGATIDPARAGW
jgi:hypothetical protein